MFLLDCLQIIKKSTWGKFQFKSLKKKNIRQEKLNIYKSYVLISKIILHLSAILKCKKQLFSSCKLCNHIILIHLQYWIVKSILKVQFSNMNIVPLVNKHHGNGVSLRYHKGPKTSNYTLELLHVYQYVLDLFKEVL